MNGGNGMSFKNFLKYRSVWMAVAIMFVAFFHSDFSSAVPFFEFVKRTGCGGVDIFFFASGIGCYYSLRKDSDPVRFIKRRFNRLAPTYFVFIVLWIILRFFVEKLTFSQIIGNFFGVQYFTNNGGEFNWYIGALILFYLLSPYIFALTEKTDTKPKTAAVILLSLVISLTFLNAKSALIIASRFPIFIIGMAAARDSFKVEYIKKKYIVILGILSAIGLALMYVLVTRKCETLLWQYGLMWYPYIIIVPGVCLLISAAANALDKTKVGKKIVSFFLFVSRYTFEIYLLHIVILQIFHSYYDKVNDKIAKGILNIDLGGCFQIIPFLILITAGVFVLKKLTDLLVKFLNKTKKKS